MYDNLTTQESEPSFQYPRLGDLKFTGQNTVATIVVWEPKAGAGNPESPQGTRATVSRAEHCAFRLRVMRPSGLFHPTTQKEPGPSQAPASLTGPNRATRASILRAFYFLACRTGTVSVLLASSLPRSLARARPYTKTFPNSATRNDSTTQ